MHILKIMALCAAVISLSSSALVNSQEADDSLTADNNSSDFMITDERIPCPDGFIVEINPAVENSLTYTHENMDLSVNVTYIADSIAQNASPEAFARVSAQQLNCHMPVHSNLIEKGWSFMCDDYATEAVIYGQKGDLVMLTISGRSSKTESKLEDFIKFLDYQARR